GVMEYTKLGATGLDVSRICLGCMSYGVPDAGGWPWSLDADDAKPFFRQALDAGINFFDTADVYSAGTSEEITGRWLNEMADRDEIVVATKVFNRMRKGPNGAGLSRKAIMTGIDASLRRLGMDHVDLYQIHRWDHETPIEETMKALHDVVSAGKARYIGASSMFAWQFAKAQHVAETHGWTRFVSMQNHYNLVYREEEREMIPLCLDQGVGVIPWSPLARGLLTGSRSRGGGQTTVRSGADPIADAMYVDDDFDVVDAVRTVAAERGLPPARIALAWLLGRPGVTAPIIGATQTKHLEDAVAAVGLGLSEDEVATLQAPYRPHAVIGHH
ncbi:aldo/keto reductase, partial [Actinophytocola sp.]|uniref:aldo/keto reductase n=1 Tax=Actinophytocola sp. TaxID=1872138 RepID=UPI002ED00CCB